MTNDSGAPASGTGSSPTGQAPSGLDASRVDPSRVIFLDIDGPMIPATMFLIDRMCSWKRLFPATTIACINRLCADSGAKIVFNTTHNRPMADVLDIAQAIVRAGVDQEHLHPSDMHTRYPDIPRDRAVKEWLARHDEVEAWVAIDDVKCADEPNMILVDPDAGLHVGHLNLASMVLGGKPCIILI